MFPIRHFLIFGTLCGIIACTSPSKREIALASLAPDMIINGESSPKIETGGIPVSVNLDNKAELKFAVEDLWTENAYLQQIHHDTVYLMLGLVENISGHRFLIELIDKNIQVVTVFQRFETSLTLMDEGPHVDLTDWKHYISEWEELPLEDLQFSSAVYDERHYQQFPQVTPQEILQAVDQRVKSNERWTSLARKCQDPLSYPCGVSISRYFLKIRFRDAQAHTFDKIVVFEVPMGC